MVDSHVIPFDRLFEHLENEFVSPFFKHKLASVASRGNMVGIFALKYAIDTTHTLKEKQEIYRNKTLIHQVFIYVLPLHTAAVQCDMQQ